MDRVDKLEPVVVMSSLRKHSQSITLLSEGPNRSPNSIIIISDDTIDRIRQSIESNRPKLADSKIQNLFNTQIAMPRLPAQTETAGNLAYGSEHHYKQFQGFVLKNYTSKWPSKS